MHKNKLHLITVVLVSILCAALSDASEKVELKVKYSPNTKYRLKTISLTNMSMTLQNPFSVTQEVRNNFPKSINSKDESIIDIRTGRLIGKNTFPITFEVVKNERMMNVNGSNIETEKSKLIGVRAHATSDFNGNMKFTKFEGKTLSQDEMNLMATIFEQLGKSTQIKLKPVAVGESFIQKMPLNVPIPGIANIRLEMEQICKLSSLENNIAEFDVIYRMKLLQSSEDKTVPNISASGKGSGKILYNKEKGVQTSTVSKFEIKGKIPIEGSKIEITSSSSQNTTTEFQ